MSPIAVPGSPSFQPPRSRTASSSVRRRHAGADGSLPARPNVHAFAGPARAGIRRRPRPDIASPQIHLAGSSRELWPRALAGTMSPTATPGSPTEPVERHGPRAKGACRTFRRRYLSAERHSIMISTANAGRFFREGQARRSACRPYLLTRPSSKTSEPPSTGGSTPWCRPGTAARRGSTRRCATPFWRRASAFARS